jgi:hypothetical protein
MPGDGEGQHEQDAHDRYDDECVGGLPAALLQERKGRCDHDGGQQQQAPAQR